MQLGARGKPVVHARTTLIGGDGDRSRGPLALNRKVAEPWLSGVDGGHGDATARNA